MGKGKGQKKRTRNRERYRRGGLQEDIGEIRDKILGAFGSFHMHGGQS